MPAGKGTYGSKVGRPKKKVTKMDKGGMKKETPSDFDTMAAALKREYGVKKAKEILNQLLGGPTTDEQGVTRFKKGGVKIKGGNVTKPPTKKQYQDNLKGKGTSKTSAGKTKGPASYRSGGIKKR